MQFPDKRNRLAALMTHGLRVAEKHVSRRIAAIALIFPYKQRDRVTRLLMVNVSLDLCTGIPVVTLALPVEQLRTDCIIIVHRGWREFFLRLIQVNEKNIRRLLRKILHARRWAETIGINTYKVVDGLLTSGRVEQQSYRACMGLLKLAEKKSPQRLEAACAKALQYSNSPSYKSIKNILATDKSISEPTAEEPTDDSAQYGITRGARHYGGNRS